MTIADGFRFGIGFVLGGGLVSIGLWGGCGLLVALAEFFWKRRPR